MLSHRRSVRGNHLLMTVSSRVGSVGHPRVHRDGLLLRVLVVGRAQPELVAEIQQGLVGGIPAGIAAFEDVDQAPGVPGVGVIVAGEEIAVVVPGKILGLAKTSRDLFLR